jgi:hypothetical protein
MLIFSKGLEGGFLDETVHLPLAEWDEEGNVLAETTEEGEEFFGVGKVISDEEQGDQGADGYNCQVEVVGYHRSTSGLGYRL